jgi:hypothetical protein
VIRAVSTTVISDDIGLHGSRTNMTLTPAFEFQDSYSVQLVAASSQYASMSNTDLGTYDDARISICVSAKRDSLGTQGIFSHWGNTTPEQRVSVLFIGTKIWFYLRTAAGTTYSIQTNSAFDSLTETYNIQAEVDLDNATQADRMIIRVNDVAQATSGAKPGAGQSLQTVTSSAFIGRNVTTQYMDGQLNHLSLHSNFIPNYDDIWTEADNPKDISGSTGLHLWVRFENNWQDDVLAEDWTPFNVPTFVSN